MIELSDNPSQSGQSSFPGRCIAAIKRLLAHREGGGPVVRLTGRPSRSAVEQLIVAAIRDAGVCDAAPRDAVVERLVGHWLANDFRDAWAVDVGIWGPWLLPREANRLLNELKGDFVKTNERCMVAEEGCEATSIPDA